MNVQFKAAQKGNCYEIAELIDIASGGLLDFLYHDLIPGKTPIQMVADVIKEESGYYSCANTIVAKVDNDIVGISLSYPSRFHGINDAMKNFLPEDRLNHMYDFFASVVPDSLYIDSLAVHKKYRRRGICSRLISLAADRARREGLLALSLIVLADNDVALKLYKKHGFRSFKDIRLDYHELIPHHGGAYLMKCDL